MKFLRMTREKLGISQKSLAQKLGVDENTVWRWEAGRSQPSVDLGRQIADALGVSVDDLLNGPAEETREFTLVYDREGDLRMEVLNMAANAPEQRVMSVSRERIAALINIKTSHLPREVAKQTMLDEMAARFDEAWAQQEKWKEAGA